MSVTSYGKNMKAYTSHWNDRETFKLFPTTNDCPFAEVIYDPTRTLLVVISKFKKQNLQLVPKLDDNGNPIARDLVYRFPIPNQILAPELAQELPEVNTDDLMKQPPTNLRFRVGTSHEKSSDHHRR